jgi:hypothetical protein
MRYPKSAHTFTLSIVAAAALLAACGAQVSDARIGTPRPARDANCDLDVVSATDMATMAKYEQVGIVRLSNAEQGTDPLDPEVRALVRPRACALGGEAISVLASGDAVSRNGLRETAYAGYVVWAKKTPATAVKKF